jgi:hypothetical protein
MPWKTPLIFHGGAGLSKVTVVVWAWATCVHASPRRKLAMMKPLQGCVMSD